MEYLFYVCFSNLGISHFNNSCESMTSIDTSNDKSKWKKFDYEEAAEVKRHTGWKIVKCEIDEEE